MATTIQLGYLDFFEAAPLLVAKARGYFDDENVDVELVCELGLMTLAGRLGDCVSTVAGANVPASLPTLLRSGCVAHGSRMPMHVVGVTSYQGMAVVLSPVALEKLRHSDARSSAVLLRMGVASLDGRGKLLIRRWWRAVAPAAAAGPVILPVAISQLLDFMQDGVIDGFCGPDPLGLLAQMAGSGHVVATSATLAPMHPGAVLAVREEFASREPEVCEALGRAVARAAAFCAESANQGELFRSLLSGPSAGEFASELCRAAAMQAMADTPGFPSIAYSSRLAGGIRPQDVDFIAQACRTHAAFAQKSSHLETEIGRQFSDDFGAVKRSNHAGLGYATGGFSLA